MEKECLSKINTLEKTKKQKKQDGITLIALVVTIVVLLILAGITISLVFSENGIIAKAREAAEKTNQAVINEQAQMNEVATAMENMINGIGESETEKTEMPEGWDDTKVEAIKSADNVVVPVPKGYTESEVTGENTVKDGFVIYEGEEPVTDESDIEEAQTTRNQFVWVPVADSSDMYGIDEEGKKWGKLYSFSSTGIIPLNWTEEEGVTSATSYREPDVVIGSGSSFDAVSTNLQQAGLDSSATADTFKTQLETDFNKMIESVERYGGFYIGRYETGNLSQAEAVVEKNNTDIANQTWYTMYNKAKGIAANSNVTTTMIWGCQWDAVMRWMYNSGDIEKKRYTYDSAGKGNYKDTNGNHPIPTGSISAYAVNNIYDMAGNVEDWAIEANSADSRADRGGCSSNDVSNFSSSFHGGGTPTGTFDINGCRVTLYM